MAIFCPSLSFKISQLETHQLNYLISDDAEGLHRFHFSADRIEGLEMLKQMFRRRFLGRAHFCTKNLGIWYFLG